MYGSVPTSAPSRVSVEVARRACGDAATACVARSAAARSTFAMPKSSTLTWPAVVTKMFSGLRSRWTMPSSCARASARATGTSSSTARDGGSRSPLPIAPMTSRSGWPSRNSSTMYGMPCVLADLVDDDDVLVVALRGRARLDEEALGDSRDRIAQELDRDAAAELAYRARGTRCPCRRGRARGSARTDGCACPARRELEVLASGPRPRSVSRGTPPATRVPALRVGETSVARAQHSRWFPTSFRVTRGRERLLGFERGQRALRPERDHVIERGRSSLVAPSEYSRTVDHAGCVIARR